MYSQALIGNVCVLLTGFGFLIVMPKGGASAYSVSVIMLRGRATAYCSWFVCLSDPAISHRSLKTKR